MTQRLSIVVPAYDEAAVLPVLHAELDRVMTGIGLPWEVIYVNDGSRDGTLAVLDAIRTSSGNVAVLNLSRNFGKEIAMSAGLDHAHGDAVIIIDADLQDPPSLIPDMVAAWQAGADMVYAQRRARAGESAVKKLTARSFYRVLQKFSAVDIPPDVGDFRLISRRAVDALMLLRERHRFMKGLFAWVGFKTVAVPYDRAPRAAGITKWNYWKLWNFAIEGITSFTITPLKIATYSGLAVAVLAFLFLTQLLVRTALFGNPVAGYPSLMAVVLALGGVQLMTLGVIGEYLGRVFNEVKNRPLYLVDRFDPAPDSPARPRPALLGRQPHWDGSPVEPL